MFFRITTGSLRIATRWSRLGMVSIRKAPVTESIRKDPVLTKHVQFLDNAARVCEVVETEMRTEEAVEELEALHRLVQLELDGAVEHPGRLLHEGVQWPHQTKVFVTVAVAVVENGLDVGQVVAGDHPNVSHLVEGVPFVHERVESETVQDDVAAAHQVW